MQRTKMILASVVLVAVGLDQLHFARTQSNSSQPLASGSNIVFDRINELLASRRENDPSSLGDKLETLAKEHLKIGNDKDSYFSKTLKTFAALEELMNGSFGLVVPIVGSSDLASRSTCNRRGYEILRNAYKALSSYKGEPRQIELVVNECAVKHAKSCTKFYTEGFEKEYEATRTFHQLRRSLAAIFEKIKSQEQPSTAAIPDHIFAHKMVYYRGGDARLYYEALVEMATANSDPYLRHLFAEVDEETGKSEYKNMIDNDRVRVLLAKYFVAPCKDYMGRFGPDYFIPIALDLTVLAPSERSLQEKDADSGSVKTFFDGWRDYRLCRNILKDHWQEKIGREIASIVYQETV